MIVLTLGGGLGNQMFEYAFARTLQLQTGDKKIKLNTFYVVLYENNREALHNLVLNDNISVCNPIEKRMYKYLEKIKRRLFVKLKHYNWEDSDLFFKLSRYGVYYNLHVFEKDEYQLSRDFIKYVYGVYENPHYWNEYAHIIKAELQVKTEPSHENQLLLKEIDGNEAVCVHIRRGDYITNPRWQGLNVCTERYYLSAMQYIAHEHPDCRFYIFSNKHEDIEWIKQNYDFSDYCVRYVDLNNPDYEELRLMYHCRHFIIANSTFSWWAQFLSDSKNKIVCAPKYWVIGMERSAELYESNWVIFDC